MGSDHLDNVLVRPKNALLAKINSAGDVDDLIKAVELLDFAAPVWAACDYGYKVTELRQAIRVRSQDLLDCEREELRHYRRGCSLHNSTLRSIAMLEGLLQ